MKTNAAHQSQMIFIILCQQSATNVVPHENKHYALRSVYYIEFWLTPLLSNILCTITGPVHMTIRPITTALVCMHSSVDCAAAPWPLDSLLEGH